MTRPLILVADDNSAVLELMRVSLGALDAEVLTAADGEEAVRISRERCPDLVILDLLMPRLDGLSVIARLRGEPRTRAVPVLVVTGLSGAEASRLAKQWGAAGFVSKPFQPSDIAERAKALLARAPAVA